MRGLVVGVPFSDVDLVTVHHLVQLLPPPLRVSSARPLSTLASCDVEPRKLPIEARPRIVLAQGVALGPGLRVRRRYVRRRCAG